MRPLDNLHTVAILAIGTELATGEVVNSNAATLASNLTELGFVCDIHLTVPDDKKLMQWAIQHLMVDHGLIFITGGLGPTTDDFTRVVISLVVGKDLVWNEASWNAVVARLTSLNAPIVASNKQQCFFPEGATIYANNHGTASAFSLRHEQSLLIALPGPPNEIAGIWNDHLNALISSMAPNTKNQTPLRWRCLGQSESKLGELVEEALKGSGLLTGYRSHLPYIDIKVWVSEGERAEFDASWRPKLEQAISTWLIGRDDDDLVEEFRRACPLETPVYILDRLTGGYLAKRIFEHPIPAGRHLSVVTSDDSAAIPQNMAGSIVATISGNIETGAWQIALTGCGPHRAFQEQSRFRGAKQGLRLKAYAGEKVLLSLRDWLADS
jgi:nicotinamide-nucleotide amidase